MSGTQFLKGLVIILIGVILLLNNLNILDWSVWYNILKLWPLLLISLGISLIFRRRLAWIAPMVILLGIIIGAGANYMGIDLHLEGQIDTETKTFQQEIQMVPIAKKIEEDVKEEITEESIVEDKSEPEDEPVEEEMSTEEIKEAEESEEIDNEEPLLVADIQRANLHLSYDLGVFALEYPTPLAYQCQVSYRYPEFKPIEDYSISDHTAKIRIYHQQLSDQQLRNPMNRIDLKLNKDIIYDIMIETGATTIDYNLSKFKVEKFTVKSGASDIKMVVPQYNSDINIDSGVSKINIAIPQDVGVRIYLDTGLSMKDFADNIKRQNGNIYISENYSDSEYKADININAGLSQINIHYL